MHAVKVRGVNGINTAPGPEARAKRKGIRTGPEVGGVAKEIPAISGLPALAPVDGMGAAFGDVPRLGALEGHDGVELPAFQHLSKALDPGNVVTGRESKTVPDIEVAAAVFGPGFRVVLREVSGTIQGTVVQAMTVGVTGGERQPVELIEKFDPITADFTYLRWLGDRKGIEQQTKIWDRVIVDRRAELSESTEILGKVRKRKIKIHCHANNHYELRLGDRGDVSRTVAKAGEGRNKPR